MKRGDTIDSLFSSLQKAEKIKEERFEDIKYFRLKEDFRKFLRGTVYYNGEVIFGYPRIARIISLEKGIRNVQEPFWMEEKANGYNVRVAKLNNKIVAFTRSGYICPFTTDRLPDLGDFENFFKENSNVVICGEVVGRSTPYSDFCPPYIEDEISFFAFDIFQKNDWRFLEPEERYSLLSKYSIRQVRSWGPFRYDDLSPIKDILKELNKEGVEGVVFKSASGRRTKYALPLINIEDINTSSRLIFELPPEFFIQRIERFIIGSIELGEGIGEEEIDRIGKAFIYGSKETVDQFLKERKVSFKYRLRFRNYERAKLLVETVNKTSKVTKLNILTSEKRGEYWDVEMEKSFIKSTSRLASIFAGNIFYD